MKGRAQQGTRPPLFLVVLHGALFGAAALGVLAHALPEWRHLVHALSLPLHFGAPPNFVVLLASVVALGGILAIVRFRVRGRSAPLAASLSVLVAVALAWLVPARREPSRSVDAFHEGLLRCARAVRELADARLQASGDVPPREEWPRMVAETCPEKNLRDRFFRPQAPRLRFTDAQAVPPGSRAGEWIVFLSPDRARFAVFPVPWLEGEPPNAPDRDARWLGGGYRPNNRSP